MRKFGLAANVDALSAAALIASALAASAGAPVAPDASAGAKTEAVATGCAVGGGAEIVGHAA